jgi:uncharacterized protein (TIGR02300 family)
VAKSDLGTKRICPTTGKKFYDLNKNPVVSPYTGEVVPIAPVAPPRAARGDAARAADSEAHLLAGGDRHDALALARIGEHVVLRHDEAALPPFQKAHPQLIEEGAGDDQPNGDLIARGIGDAEFRSERVDLGNGNPEGLGDLGEVVVDRDERRAAFAREPDQRGVHVHDTRLLDELELHRGRLLQVNQDVEPAPAALAPPGIG